MLLCYMQRKIEALPKAARLLPKILKSLFKTVCNVIKKFHSSKTVKTLPGCGAEATLNERIV